MGITVGNDPDALALLGSVIDEWGVVLDPLCAIVAQVWRHNVERHDPDRGDDRHTLGFGSSRNVCNLAVQQLGQVPGVGAFDRNTLEIEHRGRILHAGKVGDDRANWDIVDVDWASSDVRSDAAVANARAFVPRSGTLFEEYGSVPGMPTDPAALQFLHLAWQGLADGTTRCWLGFPRAGNPPWFAVSPLTGLSITGLPEPRAAPLTTLNHVR